MSNSNDHIDTIYELIAKELEGSISIAEKKQLHSWCSSSPANLKEYNQIIKLWTSANLSDFKKDIPVFDEKEAWKKINQKINVIEKPMSSNRSLYWKWAVAASVVIACAIIGVLSLNNKTVHFVARETNTSKILPDNSSVSLNQFSSVSYKEDFGGRKREVTLHGDGFFDVTKNQDKPFIVHTPFIDIRVVGTSFYVRQDSSKNLVMVKVTSGTVSVAPKDMAGNEILLSVGESASYDLIRRQFTRNRVDDNEFYWHTRTLVFNQMRLEEVIKILNTKFLTNIVLTRSSLGACRLTTTFEQQTLEEILQIISMTLNLTVEYSATAINISGDGC